MREGAFALSAAVLLAVHQKSRPQVVTVVARRLHRLPRMLSFALARGEFDVFGSDISLIRGQRECQDDVVSFGAAHFVCQSPASHPEALQFLPSIGAAGKSSKVPESLYCLVSRVVPKTDSILQY